MQTKARKVTISLPSVIYEELENLAANGGHRVPGYIRWLVWKHLDENSISTPIFPQRKE